MILEQEYKKRRTRLSKALQKNSLSVIVSAKYQTRSNDTEYPYRQNSNFYYLCGFKEDNSVLVIHKGNKSTKTYLFVEKKDETKELWTGKRCGTKQAKKLFDVDDVFCIDDYEQKIKDFMLKTKHIYFDFTQEDTRVDYFKSLGTHLAEYKNIVTPISYLRLIKSKAEISLIKQALSITEVAHHRAMKESKTLKYEYELQAEIEYIFKKNGAYNDAYTSIVACGNSANTLHYISNDKKLVSDNLILIDAGCEYKYYASDITRTIPVNGKFTEAQKELYEMILAVELKIISMIKPKVLRSDLQKKSEELLCKGMVSLGILKGDVTQLLKDKAHKKYYPHGIGHWMGIDVHDEAPYKTLDGKEIPLAKGMVMTIEPGIYIDENDMSVPKRFRGIGIRIEDDILVTKTSYENLSISIAKTIKEIESIS